jgi:hypothetical protein
MMFQVPILCTTRTLAIQNLKYVVQIEHWHMLHIYKNVKFFLMYCTLAIYIKIGRQVRV